MMKKINLKHLYRDLKTLKFEILIYFFNLYQNEALEKLFVLF